MSSPGRFTLTESDRRTLAGWAADCAERSLHLFEAGRPDDPRPRAAIDGARAFGRGEGRVGVLRALAAGSHAAAREATEPAAVAAARAAGHAAAVAHMAGHALGAPGYAALAATLAAPDDPTVATRELDWATTHASAEVQAALCRLPPRQAGTVPLAALLVDLDTRIRHRR